MQQFAKDQDFNFSLKLFYSSQNFFHQFSFATLSKFLQSEAVQKCVLLSIDCISTLLYDRRLFTLLSSVTIKKRYKDSYYYYCWTTLCTKYFISSSL